VKPDQAEPPAQQTGTANQPGGGGRATTPQADEATHAADAKAQANVIKRFGSAVVGKAKAVAERAWQIAVAVSYRVQTGDIAFGMGLEDVADTPWDMSKGFNPDKSSISDFEKAKVEAGGMMKIRFSGYRDGHKQVSRSRSTAACGAELVEDGVPT
jgi:hypothetical protein